MGHSTRSTFSDTKINAELALQAFDAAQVMLRETDGTIVYWARGNEDLYGYTAEEATGQKSHELLKTAFPQPLADIMREFAAAGRWSGEIERCRRNGRRVLVATRWSSVSTNDGWYIAEVSNDLSEQRRLESEQAHLARIVDSSGDAIISKSLDGRIRSWNSAAERMLGYSANEAIGESIAMLFPPDLIGEEDGIIAQLRAGRAIQDFETRRRRKDGTDIAVSIIVWPIHGENGHVEGATKIMRDITAQKEHQKQLDMVQLELIHLSRISSMGTMSSWIAHELNQPLAAMSNYLSALRRATSTGQATPELISELATKADDQSKRASQIVRRLREMVEKGKNFRNRESIAELLNEALDLAAAITKHHGVSVSVEIGADMPAVDVDRIQIQQVILNLIRNACEAMAASDIRQLFVRAGRNAGGVEIEIGDTGPGLPEQVLSHLFEPFITSKKDGMGIGLSVSRQIVERHGGRISHQSRVPSGSMFTIWLPAESADGAAQ
ncbi:MAG: PAS domain S-box protein [Rhizomicrobium sp.]|jgi:two-component system sensor kinase FixL